MLRVPSPERIVQARKLAGLTQPEAAELVHLGSFQRWSEYERGVTSIELARWELFLIKTGQHDEFGPLAKPARKR